MQIIPVIDIKAGQVVLAQQGQRQSYNPLSTPLCHSSRIDDVIHAYLSIHPFTHFYIADLDALMGTGNNHHIINPLFARFPQLNFMVDCGYLNMTYTPVHATQYTPVIGTESINEAALLNIRQQTENFILSLDFSATHKPMGDAILYESSQLWPQDLIIMTLARVGKNQGPDLARLKYYCDNYPKHNFIAAGGIRHGHDLIQLKVLGIKQSLIASALHQKIIINSDIKAFNR